MGMSAEEINELSDVSEGKFFFEENIESGELVWSKAASEYFGYSDYKITNIKEKIYDMVHPDDKENMQKEFEAVISKQKEAFYVSLRIRNAKGVYVACTCKGNIVFDEAGEPSTFTGTLSVHKGESLI